MSKFNFQDLKNKVAVVTGGSGGIGFSIVEALTRVGVKVAILNRNKQAGDKAISLLPTTVQKNSLLISADVLNASSLEKAKKQIIKQFGGIDFLINCAGGNSPKATTKSEYISDKFPIDVADSFFGLDMDEMTNVFDLNLFGSLLPTKIFCDGMVERKNGSIINISSVASYNPLSKVPAYSASKASINNATKWLAVHFAKSNVRVNAIAPGFFLTTQNKYLLLDEKSGQFTQRAEKIIGMTPMGRFGVTSELQGAALFLLSDLSKFVTGIVLPVDGGFTAYSGV